MPSWQGGSCDSFVLSQLNYPEICFPEFASLYCSGLGFSTKDICARFGKELWWGSHIFWCSASCWGSSHRLLPIHWLILLLALDSFTSHHISHLGFPLSWAKYACSMMANDTFCSWRSPTTLRLKEVETGNFYFVFVGSRCPHEF